MEEMVEAMDAEWGLQQVREIQLMVGNTMENLLNVRSTPVGV